MNTSPLQIKCYNDHPDRRHHAIIGKFVNTSVFLCLVNRAVARVGHPAPPPPLPVGRQFEKSATKTGKIRKNGKKKGQLVRKWEACRELAPADGKGWLRPWKQPTQLNLHPSPLDHSWPLWPTFLSSLTLGSYYVVMYN